MEKKFLRRGPKKPPISVFQADEVFIKKILSRNSSVGNCSSRLENFRTPAEVPFKWESQPGKPKDPPKGDFFHPSYADPPSSADARAEHFPRPPPRAPMPVVSEWEVNKVRLWKKLIERGHKTVKKVRLKAVVEASITAARGPVLFGGFDGILPKSNYYREYFSSSIAPSSSHYSSSSSNNCPSLDGNLKLQNFAKGFIKWVF